MLKNRKVFLKIAQEHEANIFHFKWIDDFSAARNYALSKSTGDWILYLDGDERISSKSKNEILNIIKSQTKLGVNCTVNSINTRGEDSQIMKYIRLFRRDDRIHFVGSAHEQIEPALINQNYEIIDSNIEIIHVGYDVNKEILQQKAKRNLDLLLKDYNKNKSSYLAYQIGNSYSVLGREHEKIDFFHEALKDVELPKELRSVCFLQIADFEMRRDNLKDATYTLIRGLNENNDNTMLNLLGSQIYSKQNDYGKALNLCEHAYEVNIKIKDQLIYSQNQSIAIDPRKIVFQGLLLSVSSKNNIKLRKFLDLLNTEESTFINKLLNKEVLSISQISEFIILVKPYMIDLIILLLNEYNHKNRNELLTQLQKKHPLNSKIISNLASSLINDGKIEDAINLLEKSINNGTFESSIIMYLASIYVQTNKLEKLVSLLEKVERKSHEDPLLSKHLNVLKDKLMPLFESQMAR